MRPAEKCNVPGCTNLVVVSGMCKRHYNRYWYEIRKKGNEPTMEDLAAMHIRVINYPPRRGSMVERPHGKHQNLGVPVSQYPAGQIITEEDMLKEGMWIEEVSITAPPPEKRPRKRDKDYRRKVLHEGIAATLQVLATFYAELKELDDE